jgi:hypothetical protein
MRERMNKIHPLVGCVTVLGTMLLPGCDDGGPQEIEVSLSELVNPRVNVRIQQDTSGSGPSVLEQPDRFRGMTLAATLRYDNALAEDECLVVRGLRATLGSVQVEPSPGLWDHAQHAISKVCVLPSMFVRIDELAAVGFDRRGVTLSLHDGSRTLSVPLGDALVERAAQLVAPPSGGYRAGAQAQVRWQPATDLAADTMRLRYTGQPVGEGNTIDASAITRNGELMMFQVPAAFSPDEHGALHTVVSAASQCSSGACSVAATYSVTLPFRVVAL